GRNAHGERQIGVSGRAVQVRPDTQVSVHRANVLQDWRLLRQYGCRPRADLPGLHRHPPAGLPLVLEIAGPFHRALQRAAWAMALTPLPPSISPTLTDDLGPESSRASANSATARQSAWTGLPTPKSLQLCPPGPVNVTSNRRLPRARLVMWSVLAPSTTT